MGFTQKADDRLFAAVFPAMYAAAVGTRGRKGTRIGRVSLVPTFDAGGSRGKDATTNADRNGEIRKLEVTEERSIRGRNKAVNEGGLDVIMRNDYETMGRTGSGERNDGILGRIE